MTLRFRLGRHTRAIRADAEVVWLTPEADRVPIMHFYEVGVRFLDLSEDDRAEIAQFVANTANYWLDEAESESALPARSAYPAEG